MGIWIMVYLCYHLFHSFISFASFAVLPLLLLLLLLLIFHPLLVNVQRNVYNLSQYIRTVHWGPHFTLLGLMILSGISIEIDYVHIKSKIFIIILNQTKAHLYFCHFVAPLNSFLFTINAYQRFRTINKSVILTNETNRWWHNNGSIFDIPWTSKLINWLKTAY